MSTQRLTAMWEDSQGGTALHWYTTSAGAAAVVTALEAKSNGGVGLSWEGPLTAASPTLTAADYISVTDVATLLFMTGVGTIVKVALPAPITAIFLADGQTVDITQIGAIITAVIANVVDAGGNAVTTYIGGTRGKS